MVRFDLWFFLCCCNAFLRSSNNSADSAEEEDFYTLLDVERDASQDDIKRAYKKRSLQMHPDKLAQRGQAVTAADQERFTRMKEAYEVCYMQFISLDFSSLLHIVHVEASRNASSFRTSYQANSFPEPNPSPCPLHSTNILRVPRHGTIDIVRPAQTRNVRCIRRKGTEDARKSAEHRPTGAGT